jgi:hypothetical protein
MAGLKTHAREFPADEQRCPTFGSQISSDADKIAEESTFFEVS